MTNCWKFVNSSTCQQFKQLAINQIVENLRRCEIVSIVDKSARSDGVPQEIWKVLTRWTTVYHLRWFGLSQFTHRISNNNMHKTKYQTNTEEDVDYSKSYGLKGIGASTCVHQSGIWKKLFKLYTKLRNKPLRLNLDTEEWDRSRTNQITWKDIREVGLSPTLDSYFGYVKTQLKRKR